MSTLGNEDFDTFFENAAESVFRLETLPIYNPVSEVAAQEAYLAGEPRPNAGVTTPYMRKVMEQTGRGIRCFRVHVVHSPLTDYLRREMEWGYAFTSQAGEEIFILDTAEKGCLDGLVDEDFWLFDDTHVVRMNYRDDGEYLDKELVETPDLEHYRAQRDLAMAQAVPFNQYWRAHPQYHRDR